MSPSLEVLKERKYFPNTRKYVLLDLKYIYRAGRKTIVQAHPTTKQDKGSIHRVSPLLSQKETENQELGKNSENV